METVRIGESDKPSTRLGLGCWRMGGDAWDTRRDDPWRAALRRSLELGITHLDTAQGYGTGHSEELVGEVLPQWEERVFTATKLHLPQDPAEIPAKVEASRQRLRVDTIDLYYIHWPRSQTDLRPYVAQLQRERELGHIRGVGVSNFTVPELQQALDTCPIAAHQFCYNLVWRKPERDVLPFCREHDISVVTYSPLALGLLTGKYGADLRLEPGDQRERTVFFQPEVYAGLYPLVEEMKTAARAADLPLGDLALQWLLARPGVSVVISGARDAAQAEANASALARPAPPEVLAVLTEIADRALPLVPDWVNIYGWNP